MENEAKTNDLRELEATPSEAKELEATPSAEGAKELEATPSAEGAKELEATPSEAKELEGTPSAAKVFSLSDLPPCGRSPIRMPRTMNATTLRELEGEMNLLTSRIQDLVEERSARERDLREALERDDLTRPVLRIRELSLRPPFAVILRECYRRDSEPPSISAPSISSPLLLGEDAVTFNHLLRSYPDSPLRLLHVALHFPSPYEDLSPEYWEASIRRRAGWVGYECDPAIQKATELLRKVPCVYGSPDAPGKIEHSHETWTRGPVDNVLWSVLLVGAS